MPLFRNNPMLSGNNGMLSKSHNALPTPPAANNEEALLS